MSDRPLTPNQRRTAKARAALDAKFPTPEAKSEHYRALAEKSAEARRRSLMLAPDEIQALAEAYRVLRRVGERAEAMQRAGQEKAAVDQTAADEQEVSRGGGVKYCSR